MAHAHNHANCLALGARSKNKQSIEMILSAFFSQEPQGDRHTRRVHKINKLDY
jgi:ribose 5-phosphate isomerase RpiB